MRMTENKVWMGWVAAAAVALPLAAMASQTTTRPAATTQPTTQPARTDADVIKEQLPDYPLDTCVVSGGKLGEMGKPYNYVHKGRLVRFCCKHCLPEFKKDPDKYLSMIDKAAATRPAKTKAGQ